MDKGKLQRVLKVAGPFSIPDTDEQFYVRELSALEIGDVDERRFRVTDTGREVNFRVNDSVWAVAAVCDKDGKRTFEWNELPFVQSLPAAAVREMASQAAIANAPKAAKGSTVVQDMAKN
jgi:hypothetical protein